VAPRETFNWSAQAVSFTPPPAGWYREGELSGGVKGVRFVKERGLGQAITVGELHRVGERDRTAAIRKLLDTLDEIPRHKVLREIQLAMSRTDAPYFPGEANIAREVNDTLWRAHQSWVRGDRIATRRHVEAALGAATRFRFTLDDVMERAVVEPLRAQQGERFDSIARRTLRLADHDAVAFEWAFDHNGRTYHRREIYLVHDSHLFTIRFVGLEESLPLFERIASSIEFPQ
jgi:hypothetical protein